MRIAFFSGPNGFNFLRDIINKFSEKETVRVYEIPVQEILNGSRAQEIFSLMEWSDISWFEWCEPPLTYASQFPKVCKIVVRLHRYEAYTSLPSMVNWNNVDLLIFVSDFVKRIFESRFGPLATVRKFVVHNAVNLEKFDVRVEEKKNNFKIAYIGGFRPEKNPMLAIYCLKELVKVSSDFKLFFIATDENLQGYELEIKLYLEHLIKELGLKRNVIWEQKLMHEEMKDWFRDKAFFLSTSIVEGSPVGLLEAMACGCKPLIHNFPGATELFPSGFIFNTVDDCVKLATSTFEPLFYRKFIENKFSLNSQLALIEEILTSI